jgi:hypothetical protein
VKHLENEQIQRYRLSKLTPIELLEFDDHIADCDACRFMTLQNSDLDNLYESFTTVSTQKESSDKFIDFENLFVGWKLSLAFGLICTFIFLGGLFYFANQNFQKNKQMTLAESQPEIFSKKINEPIVEKPQTPSLSEDTYIAKTSKQLSNNKLAKQPPKQTVKSKEHILPPQPNETKTIPAKAKETNLQLIVTQIESDESQTLGSESDNANSLPINLKISNNENEIFIKVDTENKVNDYEFYLAEMPKLNTTLRKNVKTNSWRFSKNNLKKNRSYVLQVTVNKEDGKNQTIKKILKLSNR